MLLSIGFPSPATPRLNDLMSRRKRFRNWFATGLPKSGGGVGSVKISATLGVDTKSLMLDVHSSPPWQVAHPATLNRTRPAMACASGTPPCTSASVKAPLGVRIANCTHSFNAVSAGTLTLLPGKVTVSCSRLAFGGINWATTHGGLFGFPTPSSSPWVGRNVLVCSPLSQGTAGPGPGPE